MWFEWLHLEDWGKKEDNRRDLSILAIKLVGEISLRRPALKLDKIRILKK